MATTQQDAQQAQAGMLLQHVAGFVATRTIALGLKHGILEAVAGGPASPEELAGSTGLDPFYTEVWCRAALGAGVLERTDGGRYALAPYLETLLLDVNSPAHASGLFRVMTQPEVFDWFDQRFASGERVWWDQCGPGFIEGVSYTGRGFYNRLIPGGLQRVTGLSDRIDAAGDGAAILETACGAGVGLAKLAAAFSNASLVGVDGDAYSLELAERTLSQAGLGDRVDLVQSPLEEMDFDASFDVCINNISMHECRDIDEVTARTHRALRPGGIFVISDFPFPADDEGLRSPPGRVMGGVQFFEALIDDQLLPPTAYVELLERHGFEGVESFQITPMHAVTHGARSAG